MKKRRERKTNQSRLKNGMKKRRREKTEGNARQDKTEAKSRASMPAVTVGKNVAAANGHQRMRPACEVMTRIGKICGACQWNNGVKVHHEKLAKRAYKRPISRVSSKARQRYDAFFILHFAFILPLSLYDNKKGWMSPGGATAFLSRTASSRNSLTRYLCGMICGSSSNTR